MPNFIVESSIINVWIWLVQPWNGCLSQPWNAGQYVKRFFTRTVVRRKSIFRSLHYFELLIHSLLNMFLLKAISSNTYYCFCIYAPILLIQDIKMEWLKSVPLQLSEIHFLYYLWSCLALRQKKKGFCFPDQPCWKVVQYVRHMDWWRVIQVVVLSAVQQWSKKRKLTTQDLQIISPYNSKTHWLSWIVILKTALL